MSKMPQTKLPPFPEMYPDLLKEWDYEKNAGIDPNSISAGSPKKVYWKCKKIRSTCGMELFATELGKTRDARIAPASARFRVNPSLLCFPN